MLGLSLRFACHFFAYDPDLCTCLESGYWCLICLIPMILNVGICGDCNTMTSIFRKVWKAILTLLSSKYIQPIICRKLGITWFLFFPCFRFVQLLLLCCTWILIDVNFLMMDVRAFPVSTICMIRPYFVGSYYLGQHLLTFK